MTRKIFCCANILFLLSNCFSEALMAKSKDFYLVPPKLIPKGSSEYYPSSGEVKIVIPIQVWGEVNQPGVHYVKPNAKVSEVIGAAGGPTGNADIDDVRIISKGKKKYLSLFDNDLDKYQLRPNDTIYIDDSWKNELPLIFGGVTTIVSVLTLYFVTKKK